MIIKAMRKKTKKPSLYPHYRFNRTFAQALNEDHYETWLYMDEGLFRPYPQRWHNFLVKYGKINKKTKKSVLSYFTKKDWENIKQWVIATHSERKQMLKEYPRWCTLFNITLRHAILQYKVAVQEAIIKNNN